MAYLYDGAPFDPAEVTARTDDADASLHLVADTQRLAHDPRACRWSSARPASREASVVVTSPGRGCPFGYA